MEDKADRELYLKLSGGAGDSVSMTAYVKRMLEEYFTLNIKIAYRQEFHNQLLSVVREEMQSQGMKLVGALLAGIGSVSISKPQTEIKQETAELPGTCEKLPDELSGVFDFISKI